CGAWWRGWPRSRRERPCSRSYLRSLVPDERQGRADGSPTADAPAPELHLEYLDAALFQRLPRARVARRHDDAARPHGEQVTRVVLNFREGRLDELHALVLEVADRLVADPGGIDDGEALVDHAEHHVE